MRLCDVDLIKERLLEKCFFPAIVKHVLETAPTIEAEPVRYAEWITPDEHYPDTCSSCLFEFVWDGDEKYKPKFCPDCGAKMSSRNGASI